MSHPECLEAFQNIGKNLEERVNQQFAAGTFSKNSKKISFYEFLVVIAINELSGKRNKEVNNPQTDSSEHKPVSLTQAKAEGNSRIIEYIRLLEEYERKCDSKANYDEAKKVFDKISEIKGRELDRQNENLKSNQNEEVFELEKLQAKKIEEFKAAWKKYTTEFDTDTKKNVENLKQRQENEFVDFLEKLEEELQTKYQKQSTQVLNLRKQQEFLSKERDFAEAARVKAIADAMESNERESKESKFQREFTLRVEAFKKNQQKVLDRIEFRIKQEKQKQRQSRERDLEKLKILNCSIRQEMEQKHRAKQDFAASLIRNKFHFCKKKSQVEKLPKIKFSIPKDYSKVLLKKRSQSALQPKVFQTPI